MTATFALKWAFLAATLGYCATAFSGTADSGASMFSFGGFGTFGVAHSSEDRADFVADSFEPSGAGYTSNWSASVDSIVGAQVTAKFSPSWSAVVQAVSQQNYDNTWTPHVEWANLKWQVTPDFSIRAGRTALPLFMYTDTRDIGYTSPWVRLPVEVYTLVPITSNDGVDASYRFVWGAASDVIQLAVGRTDAMTPGTAGHASSTAQSRRVVAISDSYEQGFTTLHFTYSQAKVTIPAFDSLFDAFRQFGAQGIAIADRYDIHNALFTFLGVGADFEPGSWFAISEWARENSHSVLGSGTGWYVSSGYHIARFTPYVTYAALKADSNTSDPGLTVSGLPPSLAIPATGLNGALNSILGSIAVQKTMSVGLRWDLARNADLTLQLDHTRLGAGSPGSLINIQPGFQRGGRFNLFSVAIDFVF